MKALFKENSVARKLRRAGRLSVGAHTYGRPDIRWWGEDVRLDIGKYCSIANRTQILLGGNHHTEWVSTYPFSEFEGWPEAKGFGPQPYSNGSVRIGNDVWIGIGASVMSGVTIGDGAVVAAYAVVTKDVEPYEIVGGSPAKRIRMRLPREDVDRLLKLQWWDWPEAEVRAAMPLLLSGDVDGLVEAHRQRVSTSA